MARRGMVSSRMVSLDPLPIAICFGVSTKADRFNRCWRGGSLRLSQAYSTAMAQADYGMIEQDGLRRGQMCERMRLHWGGRFR